MKNKEEVSVQNRFHAANALPQRVTEMKLRCTITPDLFQCDQPFSWTAHCILYTTFSTAKCNVSPGMVSMVSNLVLAPIRKIFSQRSLKCHQIWWGDGDSRRHGEKDSIITKNSSESRR
ncbi:hypothetical protein AVEN_247967-1 [Araneus ventricosus]|uniref:Uncharacterized protein n=1 Tax=Araneus ventricosus TaxID=182803 RepID=A0A4Y2CIC1_ARAVE|nr:hypothetical protein AVEN_247967-1 [Araneus ventricosus]